MEPPFNFGNLIWQLPRLVTVVVKKLILHQLIKGKLLDMSGLFTYKPTRWRHNEREI